MITEEERANLKVGDIVYFVHYDEDGYPDYSRLTFEYFDKDIASLSGNDYFIKHDSLFLNLTNAIERIIEMHDKKIKNLIKDKEYYIEKLESLENGN